jgi:fermentation-respiration switch protein FrsA (DUF1100 family)
MRTNVEFPAQDGTILRAWYYRPDGQARDVPGIVMSHGFSAVKEQLQDWAAAFCDAGLAVLLYDHRNLGTSDGLPRQEVDPSHQIRDMRQAITKLQLLDGTDSDLIGLWGTSYSGGHVLHVAGVDKRVKAVVSQVPLVAGYDNFRRIASAENFPLLQKSLNDNRAAELNGGPLTMIPVSSTDPAEMVAFPGARTHYFTTDSVIGQNSRTWRNECTLRSVDYALEYDVTPFLKHISPAALLMIVAETVDNTTPADLALQAFNTALEPKKAITISGDHYSPYFKDEDFDVCSAAAIEWFTEHLVNRRRTVTRTGRAVLPEPANA